jgi:cytidine deaminase
MAAAITTGDNDFIAVAIVADSNQPAMPCGSLPPSVAEF